MSGLGTVLVEPGPAAPESADVLTRAKNFVKRYSSAKVVGGAGILVAFVAVGVLGPILTSGNPTAPSGASLEPPSLSHWLGTTLQGQDVFTQLVDGTRSSLEVGFIAGALATAVAVAVGLVAGYIRGLGGEVFSAISNVFLVIPSLPLIIVLAGYLPKSGFLSITIVIAITSWAGGARLIRSQTLAMVQRDYVQSAKAVGEPRRRILFAEILPNLLAIVMSTFLWAVLGAIAAEAGLAFLGLGNVNQVSWGYMINLAEANDSLFAGAWWWWLPPALCYALVGAALALVNFGIDEVGNPRLRMVRLAAKATKLAAPAPPDDAAQLEGVPGPPAPKPAGATSPDSPGRPEPSDASPGGDDLLLQVKGLSVGYLTPGGTVTAVDDVSFALRRGEVIGIAGESGSGKSTLANALTRLVDPPGVVLGGSVLYYGRSSAVPANGGRAGAGTDLLSLTVEQLRRLRWEEIAVVFQSAMNALNPVLTVKAQLQDAITAHRPATTKKQAKARMTEMLQLVGVPPERASSYPHELSGGMRQRVGIAMALLLEPELVVLDEPTTGLDVVVQRAILERLLSLRSRLGFSVIFITHDLSLLLEMCDSIVVMYAGRMVEIAPTHSLYEQPRHPYSRRLRDAFPPLDGPRERREGIPGAPPDPAKPVPGCPFHPRCDRVFDTCHEVLPELITVGDHKARCLLYDPAVVRQKAAQGVVLRPEGEPPAAATPVPVALTSAPARPGPGRAPQEQGQGGAGEHTGRDGTEPPAPVLECRHLSVNYKLQQGRHKVVHAVDDVSLALRPGTVTAIVGESGCGKSSLLKALALLGPVTSGELLLEGTPVTEPGKGRHEQYRSAVQLVFQDPFASMNGVRTVSHHLERPLKLHRRFKDGGDLGQAVSRLLGRVSLTPPGRFASRYPHELSGGQRQRVMIGRALAVGPAVLLADEPVSMLDVSVQLDVLNLLVDAAKEDHVALLYVTHNIASARYAADTINVMYAGSVVESGPAQQVTDQPAHPYTQLLLRCTPRPRSSSLSTPSVVEDTGEPPNLVTPPSGCRFHPRCPHAMDVCRNEAPPALPVDEGRWAACWLLSPSHDPASPRPPGQPEEQPAHPEVAAQQTSPA